MDRHLIGAQDSLLEALEALNRLSGETMTLFVVDSERRLIGSLTDGDIRRALLSGHSLSDKAADFCNKECLVLQASDPQPGAVISVARSRDIILLPVVEEDRIISLIDLRSRRGFVPADAVLMAGGIGERLRPLTENCPKPLLPVGNRPIIDHNIELLRSFGVKNIHVAVNYLKEQIISHLPELDFIEEPERMGTIGALSLFTPSSPNIIVMNADLLTDINLESMYLKHLETEAWLTIAVVPYSVSVPFAIIRHSGNRVTGLSEKPTFNYFANAGIYMFRREALAEIPRGERMDATDLAERLIADGQTVSFFPIEGRWLDIGSPDDYRQACELME